MATPDFFFQAVHRQKIARGLLQETDADRLAAEYHGITMVGYFTGDPDRMVNGLRAFTRRFFL